MATQNLTINGITVTISPYINKDTLNGQSTNTADTIAHFLGLGFSIQAATDFATTKGSNALGLSPSAFAALSDSEFFPPGNFPGASTDPMVITFSKPVSDFGIDVIGSHIAGNYIVGYDEKGTELTRVEPAYSTAHTGFTARAQITAPTGKAIYTVRIYSTIVNGVVSASGYTNIGVTPAPPQSVSPTVPPPSDVHITIPDGSYRTMVL